MRKINTADIFKLGRLIKKLNAAEMIKRFQKRGEEIKSLPESEREAAIKELGIEAFVEAVSLLSDVAVEKEIYSLLEGITEKKNIGEQPVDDTVNDITEIVKQNDIFTVFTLAQRLSRKI